MKLKKKDKYFLGGVLLFALFMFAVQEVNHSSLIKEFITEEYSGVVKEKYNPRESMKVMTHVKINYQKDKIIGRTISSDAMDYIELGDSLIKVKDENLIYVVKPDGERKSFYYKRISMKTRNHWTFPKEWQDKWLESSAWDRHHK